ncbi:nuclear transport factor 2 family protein [Micromonospora cathayae]|uniref:Nuclear transport factor 2 family protein n=1 Tax=Micromonospora cathayae TaxID=3028804 RepID=A0ABY7ZLI9_9ACTN|nr:nuclear transport factor 2 family protein [Micromonospora sp. HUAS 3]WDZ83841.1 nuclear transport factor 2 family protein [Micromonospora sp. HUAS 3]
MGQNHADTVQRYYELVDAADYDAIFRMFCDDVVYERGGTETIVGLDGLIRFYLTDRRIAAGRHSVESILADDDWVAARGVLDGRLKSGELVTVRWADFHRFRNDKIWRRYTYFADQPV